MVNLPAVIFLKLENTTKLKTTSDIINVYITVFVCLETTYIAFGIIKSPNPVNAPTSLDENTGLFLNIK